MAEVTFLIIELTPKLSQVVAAWCKEQATTLPRVEWENSSIGAEQVRSELRSLLAAVVVPCVEVRDARPIDNVFLVESGSLSKYIVDAFTDRREIRLWSLPKGDCLHLDPTGWAEDQNEIFIAGSGEFAAVVSALAEVLGGIVRGAD
ncbi:MAG: hypothetical protein J0L78_00055 [Planctomycetes bacterium]|nr:hypothetical protein [Planctomycetota bacterium]